MATAVYDRLCVDSMHGVDANAHGICIMNVWGSTRDQSFRSQPAGRRCPRINCRASSDVECPVEYGDRYRGYSWDICAFNEVVHTVHSERDAREGFGDSGAQSTIMSSVHSTAMRMTMKQRDVIQKGGVEWPASTLIFLSEEYSRTKRLGTASCGFYAPLEGVSIRWYETERC